MSMLRASSISVLALTAALAASPVQAQLLDADIGSGGIDISVGGDNGIGVGIGGSDGGLGVGVDVGGDDGINADVGLGGDSAVDVGVDVGGDDGLGVDAEVGGDAVAGVGVEAGDSEVVSGTVLGGDSSPGGNVLDADVNVIPGTPVNADVNLGSRSGSNAGTGGGALVEADVQVGSQPATTPVDRTETVTGVTRLLALGSPTARAEALLERIADPGLAEIDLDASIDDRRIALVRVDEVLSEDALAEIEVAIGDNPEGRADLLAVLEDSAVLSSVLNREGVALEDVLAVEIGADGLTEVLVRSAPEALVADVDAAGLDVVDAQLGTDAGGLDADIAILPGAEGAGEGGAGRPDLAELDIDLLSEEELAELDLTLLPREEQRVAAVLRILGSESEPAGTDTGTETGTGTGTGQVTILDLDALLGEAAQADVLATLGGSDEDATLAEVEANLAITQALADAGIAPEAVVALRIAETGQVRLLVDSGVQLADGSDGDGTGSDSDSGNGGQPGTGGPGDGAGTGGGGDDAGGGSGDGGNGGNTGGGSTPGAGNGGPDAGAGTGNGGDTGAGGGNGGSDSDETGSDNGDEDTADADDNAGGSTGGSTGVNGGQRLTAEVGAFALASQTVACEAASPMLVAGEAAEPATILSAGPGEASLVVLENCGATSLQLPAAQDLHTAIAGNEALGAALAQAGLAPTDVVAVTQGDTGLTIFAVDPR
jgi:hypothetical protein